MAINEDDQHLESLGKTWAARNSLPVAETDIVSFAFARLNHIESSKPLFIDAKNPQRHVTAKMAHSFVKKIAAGLQSHGLKTGDCVSIHSFNNVLYPILWLGVIASGGCFSGGNPAYSASELLHHFDITDSKYLIVHVKCFKEVINAAIAAGISPANIFVYNEDDVLDAPVDIGPANGSGTTVTEGFNVSWFSNLLERGETEWNAISNATEANEKVAIYAITSGTTGLPKAAAISHQYLVAQGVILEDQFKTRAGRVSQLVCLPVFHAFAAQLALVLPLRTGIPTYFLTRFKATDYVKAVHQFRITDTAVVPPIITALLGLNQDQHAKLTSLRYMICAGAPMNAEVQAKLYQLLSPKLVIGQCWGATEVGWITIFGANERDLSGSVGRLLPNTELKILDVATGLPVETEGVSGEACIRSLSIFRRYEGNPDASSKALDQEGFYHTGDKVWIRNGMVFIGGRIKDTMKVNGWQVSPEELEEVIMRHPKLIDCAVTGLVRRDSAGIEQTLPKAYVVTRRGVKLSAEEIKDFVAGQVVGYKRLSGGVVFVSRIPRNPTGKILRRLLSNHEGRIEETTS